MTLPPHVIAEVQRILDREAQLALAAELDTSTKRAAVHGGRPSRTRPPRTPDESTGGQGER